MPLLNWIECNEGNYQFARKFVKAEDDPNDNDAAAWFRVYDQYLAKYGLNKMYKRLLNVMKKKALLELEFVQTREKFKLTQIEIEEENLKAMLANRGNGVTIEQSLIYLSRWVGYHLNTKKITVAEYFNLLDLYGKENIKK